MRAACSSLRKRRFGRPALLRQRRGFQLQTRVVLRRCAGVRLRGFARLQLFGQLPLDFPPRRTGLRRRRLRTRSRLRLLGQGALDFGPFMRALPGFLLLAEALRGSGSCRGFSQFALARERRGFRVGRGSCSGCSSQQPFRRFAFATLGQRTRFRLRPSPHCSFGAPLLGDTLVRALDRSRLGFGAIDRPLRRRLLHVRPLRRKLACLGLGLFALARECCSRLLRLDARCGGFSPLALARLHLRQVPRFCIHARPRSQLCCQFCLSPHLG